MNIAEWVMMGTLAGFGVYDLKRRRVPVAAVAVCSLVVLVYRLGAGIGFWELAAGLVPGAVLLLLARCTKESIGTGDGLVLCCLGLFCGLRQTVAVLGMALVLSSVMAIVLLVLRRAGRKTELPFLPCLCSGYLLGIIW